MKKLFISLFIFTIIFSSNVKAVQVLISNKTDGQLNAKIEVAPFLWSCESKEYLINPGNKIGRPLTIDKPNGGLVDTGTCCITWISFTATSGKGKGSTTVFYPPRTGFGISCPVEPINVTIRNGSTNAIFVQ